MAIVHELALIGDPVGHSLSAAYFNELFRSRGLPARYFAQRLSSADELPEFLRAHPRLLAFNVTYPLKRAVLPFVQEADGEVRLLGAANMVIVSRRQGAPHLTAYNTDCPGFRAFIEPLLAGIAAPRALVLGTGGAAAAVCLALSQLGVGVCAVSRDPAQTRPHFSLAPVISYAEVTPEVLAATPILINATPVGMNPHALGRPPLPYHALTSGHLCVDLIYQPTQTRFLHAAMEAGATVRNGLGLLYAQARVNLQHWLPLLQ